MSDMVLDRPAPDRRRIILSLGAAFVAHAVILVILALGAGRVAPIPSFPSVTIDLETMEPQPAPDSVVPPDAGGAQPALGGAIQPTSVAPIAATAGTGPAAAAPAVDAAGFVIPKPRAQSGSQPAVSGGSGFRTAGSQTGVAQSLPGVTSTTSIPAATLQQGSGTASTVGQGTGAGQRAGQGVLVAGSGTGGGSLDFSQLDAALTGAKSGSGGAGTGSGSGTAQGTGQGTATTTGTGTGDYTVAWDKPDAGIGRTLAVVVLPKLPPSEDGLSHTVAVSFRVNANGVISNISVDKSSGIADMDAKVIDAVRHCLFNAVTDTASVTGHITYIIRAK